MSDLSGDVFRGQRLSLGELRKFVRRQSCQALGVMASGFLQRGTGLLALSPGGLQISLGNVPVRFRARITAVPTVRTATLLSPITDTDDVLNVSYSGPDLTVPFVATIDSEAMTVFEIVSGTWSVLRGDPAVAHAANATITLDSTGYGLQELWESAPGTWTDYEDGLSADGILVAAWPTDASTPAVNARVQAWLAESRDHFLFETGASSSAIPTGTIIDFGGVTAPSGYLACDGSAVSRTTYAALFTAIGTTWGVGDGSTTFNVPDFRRRVAMGSGGTQIDVDAPGTAVGNTGGEESVTLLLSEIPAHSHTYTQPTAVPNNATAGITASIPDITTGVSTGAAGGSGAHNNVQPSAVVLKCIKT